MDELVLRNSEKMEKLFDQDESRDPAHKHNVDPSMSEEEVCDGDFQDFKTPLPPSSGHKSRLAWAQNSCDSGFGSLPRGALSDRSSSVGSSIRSSPQSSTSSKGRRITLGCCDFSPVTRESFSVIRSRKLDFHSADALPVSSHLEFVDEDVRSQESLSEDSEIQEERVSMEDGNSSLSPVSPGLFTFENSANSSQSRSVSPEDLELSLQDMSLEESSSSSSSSSSYSSTRSTSTSPPQHIRLKANVSQPKEDMNSVPTSSQSAHLAPVKIDVIDWVGEISKSLNTPQNTDTTLSPSKTNFMTALYLTSASDSSTPSTCSIISLSSVSHENQTDSSSNPQPITHTTCHQPQVSLSEISVVNYLNDVESLSLPTKAPASISPYKRTGVGKSDYDSILSPTKLRKMERCVTQSPVQSAVRNIFEDYSDQASGANLDTLQSKLFPSLDQGKDFCSAKSTCVCECDEKRHSDSNMQDEARQSSETICLRLSRNLRKFMPLAPSRLIGRNIGVEKLDIIEGLHRNFHLCVTKIFSFLLEEDLVSVSMVSKAWRHALEMDAVSFHKYQHHLHEVVRIEMLACSGKENAVEKDLDTPKPKPLTESKGCFSNLQFQASPRCIEQPPPKPKSKSNNQPTVQWGDELRHCPSCQHPALVRPHQGRAVCMKETCAFDFCTQCFAAYHHPKPCKPLNRSVSKKDVAGSLKSKKSLKRL